MGCGTSKAVNNIKNEKINNENRPLINDNRIVEKSNNKNGEISNGIPSQQYKYAENSKNDMPFQEQKIVEKGNLVDDDDEEEFRKAILKKQEAKYVNGEINQNISSSPKTIDKKSNNLKMNIFENGVFTENKDEKGQIESNINRSIIVDDKAKLKEQELRVSFGVDPTMTFGNNNASKGIATYPNSKIDDSNNNNIKPNESKIFVANSFGEFNNTLKQSKPLARGGSNDPEKNGISEGLNRTSDFKNDFKGSPTFSANPRSNDDEVVKHQLTFNDFKSTDIKNDARESQGMNPNEDKNMNKVNAILAGLDDFNDIESEKV